VYFVGLLFSSAVVFVLGSLVFRR